MNRRKVYGVFDTETVGVDRKWIYDLGLVVVEKTGKPIHRQRWIIDEVINLPNIQTMAYYGWKIKTFYQNMEVVKFARAQAEFNRVIEQFGIDTLVAYNMAFDIAALKSTLEFTGSRRKKFLEKKLEYFDLWNAACDSFFQQKRFPAIAVANNWVSEAGNYRTNAEVAYRFITGKHEFIETHTALEDAEIEAVILQEILRQKKRIIRNEMVSHPWKKVQKNKR